MYCFHLCEYNSDLTAISVTPVFALGLVQIICLSSSFPLYLFVARMFSPKAVFLPERTILSLIHYCICCIPGLRLRLQLRVDWREERD